MKPRIQKSAWSAGLLLSITAQAVFASEPQAAPNQSASSPPVHWRDVALDGDGKLRGQIVDQTAASKSRVRVDVYQQNRFVLSTETNHRGEFAIKGLKGGLYQVVASCPTGESGVALFRIWTNRTAPPAAISDAVMVIRQDIVRGQWCANPAAFFSRPAVAAAIITAAVLIPIAVNNSGS